MMEPGVMEEILRHFSRIYESDYPFSERVKNGLLQVLSKNYNGSEVKFKDEFVHPTITLLEQMKQENFPLLVKKLDHQSPMIVVHLVPPQDKELESGEYYFQVGHTSPGKLALKFAKYQDDGTVKTQPSNVEEYDYGCVFTNDFFSHLRKMNDLGDSMFRTLIVLHEGKNEIQKLQGKDYLRVCPEERRGRFRTWSNLSVEETCEEDKCKKNLERTPSENAE